MRVVTLVENRTTSPWLGTEHGLSIYIETKKNKILFDTGASTLFAINAEKLNIDLKGIDYVVISHGHSDHIGGLLHFLKINQKAKVILKKEIFDSQYLSIRKEKKREIGYVPDLDLYKERFIHPTSELTSIDNLQIITSIDTKFPLPKGNKVLFKTTNGGIIEDNFSHELVLAIEEENQIDIFCGCAHNGILNTLSTTQKHLPNKVINHVIGGFHLIEENEFVETESDKEIVEIAHKLKEVNSLTNFYTGHCTCSRAYDIMKMSLKERINKIEIGKEIFSNQK